MLAERVIRYATRQFRKAIRSMSEQNNPVVTFRISETPDWSLLILAVPTADVEKLLGDLEGIFGSHCAHCGNLVMQAAAHVCPARQVTP